MIAKQHIECTAIPAFNDNYIWALTKGKEVYIVDPGCAEPVISFLEARELKLLGILVTHSHNDHIGGIEALLAHYGELPVFGPETPKIPQISNRVAEADNIELWDGISTEVIAVPGHLPEHLAYFVSEPISGWLGLFSGDALFSSGCGRIFDGEPKEFHHSLQKLAKLPDSTNVYCAHEYTLANLSFAKHIECDNPAILEKEASCKAKRASGNITLPSTLVNEKETNPFLRCHVPSVRARAGELTGMEFDSDADTFTALRKLKDNF